MFSAVAGHLATHIAAAEERCRSLEQVTLTMKKAIMVSSLEDSASAARWWWQEVCTYVAARGCGPLSLREDPFLVACSLSFVPGYSFVFGVLRRLIVVCSSAHSNDGSRRCFSFILNFEFMEIF